MELAAIDLQPLGGREFAWLASADAFLKHSVPAAAEERRGPAASRRASGLCRAGWAGRIRHRHLHEPARKV